MFPLRCLSQVQLSPVPAAELGRFVAQLLIARANVALQGADFRIAEEMLEIALPITSSAGAESITLPSSHAPVSRATLSLPRGGIDLTIAGGFISERSESTTESRWTALGRAGYPLTISWKRKADDRRAELPLRYRAQVASSFGLGEEVSTMTAAVRSVIASRASA